MSKTWHRVKLFQSVVCQPPFQVDKNTGFLINTLDPQGRALKRRQKGTLGLSECVRTVGPRNHSVVSSLCLQCS